MEEILPKIFHWTALHPEIGISVHSYFLEEEGILIDPILPEEGLKWFDTRRPQHIFLTNRLHERDSARFRDTYRCIIRVHETGLHEGIAGGEVEAFQFGDSLPGDIEALEVNAICPDETALFIPKEGGIIAFADGLMRDEDGELTFVDDDLMADTPEEVQRVKNGLLKAFHKILKERHFDHLFFAHAPPLIGGGKEALQRFTTSWANQC